MASILNTAWGFRARELGVREVTRRPLGSSASPACLPCIASEQAGVGQT